MKKEFGQWRVKEFIAYAGKFYNGLDIVDTISMSNNCWNSFSNAVLANTSNPSPPETHHLLLRNNSYSSIGIFIAWSYALLALL